jgi:lipase chaperone LimK
LSERGWRISAACLLACVVLGGVGWWWVVRGNAVHTPVGSAFAKSLEGTHPDGNLAGALASVPAQGAASTADAALPYAQLRRMFDYYLSAQGEQNLDAILQQIDTELGQKLNPAQAPKARRLLGLYISYRRALTELEARPNSAGPDIASLRYRMQAQQALRGQYFSLEETQGLFGQEDAMDADAVARLEISHNMQLSALQKQQQLAALDAAMPSALRQEREASLVVVHAEQRTAELRAQGGSEDDVYRLRAQIFNASAAARLAELDREETRWKERIAAYLAARNQLQNAYAQAPPAQWLQALAALQNNLFNADERRRLPAYEQP